MIKKKQSTSYTSGMQVYDDQRADSRPPAKSNQTGGQTEEVGRVDKLGTKNNTTSGSGCFAELGYQIRTMITLPKVTGFFLTVLLIILAFYSWYPYDPIQFNQLPIPVLNENNEVRLGEDLTLYMDFYKDGGCINVEAKYYLVDGFVVEMNTQPITREVGENQFQRVIPIPTSAPVGENRHIRIEYSCQPNPIRTIEYQWDSEQFNILPGKEDL